jgi:hypothetical protein
MRELVNATTAADDSVSGTGRLRGTLQGVAAEPMLDHARGTLVVAVENGTLHDFPLISAVNSALRVAAGDERDLQFESLSATLVIDGGRATTDDLLIRSGDLTVAAAGTLSFDRTLDFRGNVTLSKEKAEELARSVKEAGRLRNSRGEIEVPVVVSGTLGSPRFSVDVAGILRRGVEDELKRRLRKGLERFIK